MKYWKGKHIVLKKQVSVFTVGKYFHFHTLLYDAEMRIKVVLQEPKETTKMYDFYRKRRSRINGTTQKNRSINVFELGKKKLRTDERSL